MKMAKRRLSHGRDRVYFYDFYEAIMAVDTDLDEYENDLTLIDWPIHGL